MEEHLAAGESAEHDTGALGPGRLQAIWLKRSRRGPMDSVLRAIVHEDGLAGSVRSSRLRQVTLIEQERWDALMQAVGSVAPPSARRANLLVSGISLARTRGRLLRVGAVHLRVCGETRPCERMEEVATGLEAAMRIDWGGGVFAQIVQPGGLAVGDVVAWIDAGCQG
jgi:MOSC domain-containing protein YiiM